MAIDCGAYIKKLNSLIAGENSGAAVAAQQRWDSIAKPLSGLGQLESLVVRIAALTGDVDVDISKRAVAMFCADNGVVEEGVSQCGSEVTAMVAKNAANGQSSVCKMGAVVGAKVFPIDVGMKNTVLGVENKSVAFGTNNFTLGSAMSVENAIKAIDIGISTVKNLKDQGYNIIVTGEMGVGNTTTAAAVASVLLNMDIISAVGRGSGLSDAGLIKKRNAIMTGIKVNKPNADDALDTLSKLGGFDIAAMAGAFIGGAIYKVPVIIDGMISSVAALVAKRLCPKSTVAMLPSHLSAEPVSGAVMEELGFKPIIQGGFHLGEGTGGVCLIPLLDMALSVYNTMVTFEDISLKAYVPLGGESK